VYEGGESERLDNLAISCGKSGILNVLSHFGMIDLDTSASKSNTIKVSETFWQRSSKSGIFIWCKSSGDLVKKGEIIGMIKDPYGYNKIEIKSRYSGIIIGHNNASIVNQGDALFHIGKDQNETSF
jgi:predicted deacylase